MATRTRRNTIRIINDPVVDHIVHEWLSAESDSELGRLLGELHDDIFDGRRQLLQYIKKPGLKDVQYTASDGSKRKLPEEDVRKLKGIPSYITHLQNLHGPSSAECTKIDPLDLTIPLYDDFQEYLEDFDIDNPTQVDEILRLRAWEVRRSNPRVQNTSP